MTTKKQNDNRLQYFVCGFMNTEQGGKANPNADAHSAVRQRSSALPVSQHHVVDLARVAHLDLGEPGRVQERPVLGGRALPSLRLHQHVEGVELGREGPRAVLQQQGLHQQHAAPWWRGSRGDKVWFLNILYH